MANHVHLLITPLVEVSQIMQSLKRFTTRAANRLLCSTGQAFWQEESFDRLVRGEAEFARITRYIEMNPGESGMVETPEDLGGRLTIGRRFDNLPYKIGPED